MLLSFRKIASLSVFFCLLTPAVIAQPGWTLDIFGKEKKPEKYEEKKLASEKTGEKGFGPVRRFMQNTTSHYNFYFNATNKIDAVMERAKIANKDNYSRLLAFYPYTLDATAAQKTELDSVIYKATAGILLHDLRSEWVDNFYMLIGQAYFLRKDFDSAALTFQFINYNLYPRKNRNDDDMKVIGTNDAGTGTGSVSIADKENRNLINKTFSRPASRNDALIWLTRTFIEQEEYGDAAGMISILQNDKNLPTRLKNDLAEVTSYWFFAQNNYDSSAVYLEKALTAADNKQDKSRWEFLLGQMYERTGSFDKASDFYARASKHTADPVMDIYARLNDAKMMRTNGNQKELENSIANLLKMAKRDRYEAYRDVLYYSAAQLSLQQPDTAIGVDYYGRSITYNEPTSGYRDRSYLQLAGIAYNQRRYSDARSFYDSLDLSSSGLDADTADINSRKEVLGRLIPEIELIAREDSLQRLAAMNPAEREALIRKMVRAYRRQQGLKEDENFAGNTLITIPNKNQPADLLDPSKYSTGPWYFDNPSARSKGFNEFKSKWGKRENVDNWRRRTASEAAIGRNTNTGLVIDPTVPQDGKGLPSPNKTVEFTYDALLADLPLSTERIDSSNINIGGSIMRAATIFKDDLSDYSSAITMYDEYLRRFPNYNDVPDAYLGLSYSWQKLGDENKAAFYRNALTRNFASSKAARVLLDPPAPASDRGNAVASLRYEGIYNSFIEGQFNEAITAKRSADSLYGKTYWTPQLLYIEAVHFIQQRQDSNAIAALTNISILYPNSPLREKAITLIDVLRRRGEIENYLTNLQVTRAEDDRVIVADDKPVVRVNTPAVQQPAQIKTAPTVVKTAADTLFRPAQLTAKSFTIKTEQPHYVAMLLNKIDGVYVNEAKNAFNRFNKGSMATLSVIINRDAVDADNALLLFSQFENADAALKYFDRIKKAAPSEVSWLQPAKYSFIIISEENLQVLKSTKELATYRELLNKNFGNKF